MSDPLDRVFADLRAMQARPFKDEIDKLRVQLEAALKLAAENEQAIVGFQKDLADAVERANEAEEHCRYNERAVHRAAHERDVALARIEVLLEVATRASAELRHAVRGSTSTYVPTIRAFDANLVDRVVRMLEGATTPKL